MSEALKYDSSRGLGNIDRILLRGAAAHKSPTEIAKLTNGVLKPAEVAVRVQEILDDRDWLTEAQTKALLVDDLMSLKDVLVEKAVTFKNLNAAKPLISVLTQLDRTLTAEKFDLNKAMNEISRAHAFLLLRANELSMEKLCLDIEAAHPEISRAELTALRNNSLPLSIREIESRVPANG
jgi:hypothetical protein